MSRKSSKKNKKNKAITGVVVVLVLVVLFFASFWVTSLILKANRNPLIPHSSASSGKPTEKLTYEQMEKLLAEKEVEIEKLKKELEWYRKNDKGKEPASIGNVATKAPSAEPSDKPEETKAPEKSPEKTETPTQSPTETPAPTPSAEPIQVPIQAPAAGDVSNE